MTDSFRPAGSFVKKAVTSDGGIVVSQSLTAARAGAAVLAEGGNAVDAAIAAGFAVGVLEPWMSGIGGGGYMLVAMAGAKEVQCVEFGMVAPQALDPADYPLTGGTTQALFDWPAVKGDRNVKGPLSVAVPGYVEGMRAAHEAFATRPWARLLEPAIGLAQTGLPIDWYAMLSIGVAARELAENAGARRVYLPGGLPPAPAAAEGPPPRLGLGQLDVTLRRIAKAGAREFYEGETARALVAELQKLGGKLSLADLAGYRARILPALPIAYRDIEVFAPPGLTAGPTLARSLALLSEDIEGFAPSAPGPETYRAYASALDRAYRERFQTMGDAGDGAARRDPGNASCTTHLSVVDRHGNMVALTQTLLSRFGSKVLLEETGVLLNNGIMWFDPTPGRPNSIAPGKRPLSNMVPTILRKAGQPWAALGASGGRRILPAVTQVLSFLVDFGMDLEAAFHCPRLDASGAGVTLDERLPAEVAAAIDRSLTVRRGALDLHPVLFASPNAVMRDPAKGRNRGMADIASPWSGAASEA
ncbi:MAG TPA: gamma-glutamyltransferase [Hypericibacter adhaerens]|jgi:gamma-glutamyltranspeptidase/glutathione hydrolase|uniref:Gamma-glutamyltransferase n=1 Tax=Hypericibacter adhaerens TaxID=2602016 RepID=A0A5J6N4J4_9PROT|nr:gamma-glutamyltransferase [Hypericibacter adhaerens]QEX24848.1 gamma-glutamyltransferase [Hypericibacter adhaerens]HWA43673.1 gamma-glutamyltransferase [Hypericibacter adhaerens]